MTDTFRVLVTASRTWDDAAFLRFTLDGLYGEHGANLVIVHGACPKGGDALADAWCADRGVAVERYPADWNAHGKSAGHRRNQQMVDTQPNLCLAFIRDASPGATGCAVAAQKAGMPVERHEYAPAYVVAARAEAAAKYPPHVLEAGGPDHYAASLSQQLHDAIHATDWATVRRVAADPYAAGDDVDMAKGALAGALADRAPASTVAELRDVLIAFEANRPRSMQKELGPSELGTPCQQQIARKLAGAPRRPITEPTWAPFQGTAVHASMEDVVAFWNTQLGRERWLAEDRLIVSEAAGDLPSVEGNGDAFDTDFDMVVDWKHTGTTAVNKLRTAKRLGKHPREQVSQEYRVQAHLYGLGHANKGRPVRFVRLVFLARSWKYDDSEEWTEAYDERIALWALGRYYDVVSQVAELDLANHPDQVAVVPASPSSDACKFCRYRRPGQPSGWDGCAGDEAAHDRRMGRVGDGLITSH